MSSAPSHALVAVAWAPARREATHRAELVTQWVCGEALEVLEEAEGWLRCRGEDGYEAWAAAGGLLRVAGDRAEAWAESAGIVSLGTGLVVTDPGAAAGRAAAAGPGVAAGPPVPAWLPLGARGRPAGAGGLELPGGGRARPLDPSAVVRVEDLASRFPLVGEAVARTAARWLGAPYVWGGRTEWGFDCSGLLQAVFGLHGVRLPRDSGPQREAGPDVPGLPAGPTPLPFPDLLEPLRPGDLLFFAPEDRGITHVALALGEGRILHAAASNGCVAVDDLRAEGALAARLRRSVVACTRPLVGRGREVGDRE